MGHRCYQRGCQASPKGIASLHDPLDREVMVTLNLRTNGCREAAIAWVNDGWVTRAARVPRVVL